MDNWYRIGVDDPGQNLIDYKSQRDSGRHVTNTLYFGAGHYDFGDLDLIFEEELQLVFDKGAIINSQKLIKIYACIDAGAYQIFQRGVRVVVNLLTDLLYARLDPRVELEG